MTRLTDMELIEYANDEYMLGAFIVQTSDGAVVTIDPAHPGPFVLYFDNEICGWVIDQADYLTWDSDQEAWVV